MAVSIDWKTFVIFVPRDDLTLVQSSPTEIRQMDINWFRMQLKALEASPEGIGFPKTHTHNTEVQLGGITYARIVEILEPYTVTFEDGQYAVDLVGANSNIGDRVNVNQVSVRSNNSAGLISTPLIEYASFEGGVWVDTTTDNIGTLFPNGTRLAPVNNFFDAKEIAEFRGFNKIYLLSDVVLDDLINLEGYVFEGEREIDQTFTIQSAPFVRNSMYKNLTVDGELDGGNEILGCVLKDISYVSGYIVNCALNGRITLSGVKDAVLNDCFTLIPDEMPVIDMGGSGQNCSFPNYSGVIRVENFDSDTNILGIGLNSGKVILDSNTVTKGLIHVSGVGNLEDENGNHIGDGTWNGNVTIVNSLVSGEDIHAIGRNVLDTQALIFAV